MISQEEVERKIQTCFAKMSALFSDPKKAEDSFQKLHSYEDDIIFATLSELLNEVTIEAAEEKRVSCLQE